MGSETAGRRPATESCATLPPAREITRLSGAAREVVVNFVPPGSACALLDFPDHANVGDSAIWLGEKALLKSIGARIVYECDLVTYSERALAERVGNGVILLHGGGNFGDVWPTRELFRERVIRKFPDNKIVILPQTIFFQDSSNLRRARSVLNQHSNLVILARDRRSFEFARNEFRAASALCPDLAFILGPLARPAESQQDILWLARTDVESRGAASFLDAMGVCRTDWLAENPTLAKRLYGRLKQPMVRHPRICGRLLGPTLRDRLAWQRVMRGARLLSGGRVVVTDRLHGHILSILLGIPHVVLDNSYGKVSDFYSTWTKDCDSACWADSPDEALSRARVLVPRSKDSSPQQQV
ncbi:MAG TPA: polysaccharide pyruvyl transferase family protein [Candidatus Acidoferrales bacterium]|nr:polysaccharide pyruvyl transferase family protein [Candidatus Acidoferrales bacterium]